MCLLSFQDETQDKVELLGQIEPFEWVAGVEVKPILVAPLILPSFHIKGDLFIIGHMLWDSFPFTETSESG